MAAEQGLELSKMPIGEAEDESSCPSRTSESLLGDHRQVTIPGETVGDVDAVRKCLYRPRSLGSHAVPSGRVPEPTNIA